VSIICPVYNCSEVSMPMYTFRDFVASWNGLFRPLGMTDIGIV
jgi:hypothetical protein